MARRCLSAACRGRPPRCSSPRSPPSWAPCTASRCSRTRRMPRRTAGAQPRPPSCPCSRVANGSWELSPLPCQCSLGGAEVLGWGGVPLEMSCFVLDGAPIRCLTAGATGFSPSSGVCTSDSSSPCPAPCCAQVRLCEVQDKGGGDRCAGQAGRARAGRLPGADGVHTLFSGSTRVCQSLKPATPFCGQLNMPRGGPALRSSCGEAAGRTGTVCGARHLHSAQPWLFGG